MRASVTRRNWLSRISAACGAALLVRRGGAASLPAQIRASEPGDGSPLFFSSNSGVWTPPRGRSYHKFSFDFPEPSVAFGGLWWGFLVFTYENAYSLDREALSSRVENEATKIECSRFRWAGGQETGPGRLEARLRRAGEFIDCDVTVEMERPVKAVTVILRGVPRGRISGAGASFRDPGEDELLFGYPFSGGDLFGPGAAAGLTTPLVIVEPNDGDYFFVSSLDDRVRTKRFYFRPGESGYRVEATCETEGWRSETKLRVPTWRVGRARTVEAVGRTHYAHVERAYGIPRWDTRTDVPGWMRRVALVVTLHGMHYTGFIFNDYARMLEILRWVSTRIPADRVLAFISAWDGRYYWDYPLYQPAPRMGGAPQFARLIDEGRRLGFRMMPMFGANAANRRQPVFSRFADASTQKIDGDGMDLNWVDWDNDRHQDGWLSYMNLGVDSWREWLTARVSEVIERYRPDAYFLDIVGGWVNNPRADMHQGTRRLVLDLRKKYPEVVGVGEMHYDALLEFIALYHSFSQTEIAGELQNFARFFQHLSHPAPGRGSTGVHEAGFGRWRRETLSLNPNQLPTLNVVDDTFEKQRAEMEAVIEHARERAGL